jgi:hypothetical protein
MKIIEIQLLTGLKVELIFAWYDFWVGFFFDRKNKWLYFFPIPMIGIIIKF